MAGKKREKLREDDATGLKYFDLLPLFGRLHEVGCQRDTAGHSPGGVGREGGMGHFPRMG